MHLFAVRIVEATECTVHTNRANSFVQQPRDVQNDCNFLVFFRQLYFFFVDVFV